jgi:ribosome-associated toxin RatA of RatAB toxin-antitoxin module
MKKINKTALVPYPAIDVYKLVADIESYPEFLSWCSGAKILSNENNTVEASISISYHGLNKTFTTLNNNDPGKVIKMKLVDGPLQYLDGVWHFQELDDTSSKVVLDIDFEIKNPVMRLALGSVFEKIANSMVEEFVARASTVYDKVSGHDS